MQFSCKKSIFIYIFAIILINLIEKENNISKFDIDATDLKILKKLQVKARISNIDLAADVGISPSACLRRVRELESNGVINKYVTIINPLILGLGVTVMISVTLEQQVEKALESFEKAVREWPEIMETYLMTGDSDYLLRVVVSDLPAYEKFLMERLTKLPGISSIKSSFALKEILHRTALPIKV
ncbi:MAG: Leucine-responsive regulatory protein [Alphaproteobacteria bacterium MarineAlpha2_Bin1]|nr:MAG: Leucine-responsive regulatory protein [Alphaproteobacteria bacterium MarineAlpha2_Bin1]